MLTPVPEDIISRTLDKSTQLYLHYPDESKENLQSHFKSIFPLLWYPRLKEGLSINTFSPCVKSCQSNTCSRFFVSVDTNWWGMFPLKKESDNDQVLKNFTRRCIQNFVKSINANSEVGSYWTEHCRNKYIEQLTTKLYTLWKNDAEPCVGHLNFILLKVVKYVNIPLIKHD